MSSQPSESASTTHANIVHNFYKPFQLPDPASPAGESILRQLHDESFIWLTTVDEEGAPQPLLVTFLWDENQSSLLTYSMRQTERGRLAHIKHNPLVSLNFDGNKKYFVIITGEATVSETDPPLDQLPAWLEKYRDLYPRLGMTIQQAAASAPVALRIRPLTLRYVQNLLSVE